MFTQWQQKHSIQHDIEIYFSHEISYKYVCFTLCICFQLIITVKPITQKKWELTEEGRYVVDNGSHEVVVYNAIPDDGISQKEILSLSKYAKLGLSKALAAGWIQLDKSGKEPLVKKTAASVQDTIRKDLMNITNITDSLKSEYKKRKLVQEM